MTRRSKHLIAYASAMISLMVWQLCFYTNAFATVSDYHLDIIYTLGSQLVCMGILPLGILLALNKGEPAELFRSMRYKAPRNWRSCLLISLGVMALITPFTMTFNSLTALFFRMVGYKRTNYLGTVYLSGGDFAMMILMTAILPAIFEEFSHRGVLLSGLESKGSEMSAVILSAVMFGLMHMNPDQMIFAVFGGLVFGVIVVKCDSIIPAICAHFANNTVSVILDYSIQTKNAFGLWYTKLSGAGTLLSVGLTFAVFATSLYGMVLLLQYAARKAPKPISEGKLLGVVTLDKYESDGKATLKDNLFLLPVMISEGAVILLRLLWGIVK